MTKDAGIFLVEDKFCSVCNVCYSEDGSVKHMKFRRVTPAGGEGNGVALCRKCRLETLSVLAREVVDHG